jgi:hypothetical protein
MSEATIVRHPGEVVRQAEGVVPVLAPSQWLTDADPLPHTWDVTSDSIAAWIAGQVRALLLVVVKPPAASGSQLVDPYFPRVLPADVVSRCVDADEAIALLTDLAGVPADCSVRLQADP